MGQFPQDGCLLIRMSQTIQCLKRFCDYISNTNIFFGIPSESKDVGDPKNDIGY